ncbi:hypothetical protein [Longimicrobium sp.]|uniref:hypothetical protein n=1 Tax=Longimicrobium sp. TaxID=2029185 RepID=UPI002CA39C9C|nr:hypothetical protein [Longimicrobium sp.]HSU14918.1 hypothetical protein [Longimicrobium sp.]
MMDGRFEFDAADVLRLVEETNVAGERMMTEAQRYLAAGVDLHSPDAEVPDEVDHPGTGAPPGLWLMNDRGVYLRSNARKRPADSVAFARGYRAEVPVGGEPICEFVDAGPLAQLRPGDTLVVTLSEAKMRLSLIRAEG